MGQRGTANFAQQAVASDCGKTMPALLKSHGPHVWDNRTRPRRIAEPGRLDERDASVRGFRNFEPRTSDRAFLACLALHAAQSVAAGELFQHPARDPDGLRST
jgi:hypothetical protein